MISSVIVTVIFAVVIERATVVATRQTSDGDKQDDHNSDKPYTVTSTEEKETSTHSLHSLEDEAKNSTSLNCISYHTKRGVPKYTMRLPYHRGSSSSNKPRQIIYRDLAVSHPKSRKKHRRSRRRPEFPLPPVFQLGPHTMSKPPSHTKVTLKRSKPILLSEVLRSGPPHPYAKYKPPSHPVKEYMDPEEEEAEPNDFYSFDMDSLPPIEPKYERPPSSIEISDDVPDGLAPLSDIEDEIYYPGAVGTKPFPQLTRFPSPQIYSWTKPPDVYVDNELQDNIRNVRFASKPPNGYVEQNVMSILKQMRNEGIKWDSEPAKTTDPYLKENFTDMTAAISKILLSFLSEHAVKKLYNHISTATNEVQTQPRGGGGGGKEKNIMKMIYVVKDPDRELGKKTSSETPPTPLRNYSAGQPARDGEKSNATTYYIMLKTPKGFRNSNSTTTTVFQTVKNHTRVDQKRHEHTTRHPEVTTTPATNTIPSQRNLALQHYIMSLAGITQNQDQNYSPRLNNSSRKQPRSYH